MKKTVCFFFLFCSFSTLFSAPLATSPVCNDAFKTSIYMASDIYTASNDIYNMFTLGLRYGIPGNSEIGVRVFKSGLMGDAKLTLFIIPPFYGSYDLAVGYVADAWNASIAFMLDMQLDPNFSVYIAARWLYPANNILDTSNLQMSGVMFSPRIGVEFFRKSLFSIIVEGGVIKSWYTAELGFNAAALIGYNL